ncbi:P-loop containing nucleoside triphosphate hydrolase protein [Lophiotrema nucula]|uniref:ATP-dependent RNA helicase ROK1 n=1 Tax=Lophiotrema nucula TaxID=690887 RepID=A0A6A5YLF0_9PLEO|nr:P-loop containing nucleoside triphosphate hydrolase protein [Lophiotrema nucula]
MNVFKLLSRTPNASQTAPAQKLPSSGAVANPQLFGHDEPHGQTKSMNNTRKGKRRRDSETASAAIPAELDFFSGASRKAGTNGNDEGSSVAKTKKEKRRKQSGADDTRDVVENNEEPLDADECRRILRSHKLKIVVLEDFAPAVEEPKKEKKKKSKKRKREQEEAEKAKKQSKQQLFPQPLTSFAQLRSRHGISRKLAENIKAQGYTMPTEVQLGALPILLGAHTREAQDQDEAANAVEQDIDLLTIAPTGSGKTIAFLIPIINSLLAERDESDSHEGPRAIILAPTKELASQIVNEARKLAAGTRVKAALMKKGMEIVTRSEGDTSVEQSVASAASQDEEGSASESDAEGKVVQRRKQKRRRAEQVKAAILVATPLALLNALKTGEEVAELPSIRQLVLDEADVLLDPLFREQTLSVWNACTNPSLRVGLWSATMGSNIEALTINTINDRWSNLPFPPTRPVRAPLIRLVVGLKDSAIPNIDHKLVYAATEQGKLLGLRQLLHPTSVSSADAASLRPPFLVFTQTIPRAIALHSELLYDIPPEAGGSSRIAVLHADLSSTARDTIMTRFRRGEIWVLITTDLLARGVDFRGLNGVVNYDVPNSAAAYVHRVGRTGRAGREGGVAVTFYTQEDVPYVKNVANVIRASEKLRGVREENESVKQWLLDALPTPTKRDKQRLKKRGVEARRTVKNDEGKVHARISTKSGYERRLENNRSGAKEGSRRREGGERKLITQASEREFDGFEE